MFLFKSKRPRGGQFISFEYSSESPTKAEWQKSSSKSALSQRDGDITEVMDSDRSHKSSTFMVESDLCANHVLVNAERESASQFLLPLRRSGELEQLARKHAESMASQGKVYHADADELVSSLRSRSRRLGMNVMRGRSLEAVHFKMMTRQSTYYNMVDWRYVEMGMSTARGKDGKLYVCQLFRC